MSPLSICTADSVTGGLASFVVDSDFAALDANPYWGRFGRAYYPAANLDRRTDCSFAVLREGQPLLLVPCSLGSSTLDWYDLPMQLFLRDGLPADVQSAAYDCALAHLDTLAKDKHARIVVSELARQSVSLLGHRCLVHGAAASIWLTAIVDLTEGEAGMRRGLRKSFKSLLNWGKRSLETRIVAQANPDRGLFDEFQAFHTRIAGRSTRPQASWDITYDWIAGGHGELIASFLGGKMVGGTLVVDGSSIAAYATGAYDREHFDTPLAHWPLWLSMVRAAERGMKTMDLGGLPLPPEASEKEQTIAYFKRGFATSISLAATWAWSPAEAR